jgi:hypothetical protein
MGLDLAGLDRLGGEYRYGATRQGSTTGAEAELEEPVRMPLSSAPG